MGPSFYLIEEEKVTLNERSVNFVFDLFFLQLMVIGRNGLISNVRLLAEKGNKTVHEPVPTHPPQEADFTAQGITLKR